MIFTCGPRILWDYLFYVNRYARHPERYPLAKRYAKLRSLVIFVFAHFRTDWHVEGLENILAEKKPFLLISNHLSFMDPLAVVAMSPRPMSFIAKKESLKMPFIGKAIKALQGEFLDREDLRQSVRVFASAEEKIRNCGMTFVIYPEGTRNKDHLAPLAPFHPGSLKLAYRTGSDIITCAQYGSFRLLDKKANFKRFPYWVRFSKPLTPAGYANISTIDLAVQEHDDLQIQIDEMVKQDAEFFAQGLENIPMTKGIKPDRGK